MSRVCLLALFAMSLALAPCMPAAAQDNGWLAELYGDGVHAYFAGNNQAAYEALTEAIDGGTDDPRAFYFRGLVLERMGRDEAAASDFEAGAIAEVRDTDRFYNVNVSLQRVQGYTRLAIEDYRQQARVSMAEQVQAERARRSGLRQGAEAAVLRGTPPAPTRDFERIEPRDGSEAIDDDDLFGEGGGVSGNESDIAPAPVRGGQDDLFPGETGSGAAGLADEGMESDPFDNDSSPSTDEPFPFDFEDEGDELGSDVSNAGAGDEMFPSGDEGDVIDDASAGDRMQPGPSGDAGDEGPGGSFGLGDAVGGLFGGGGSENHDAGPPGMDDSEFPYEDGDEELSVDRDGNHQAGPPGMDDREFPYESEDAEVNPFADDQPGNEFDPLPPSDGRPEMGDERLREADPVPPGDDRPEMGDEFLRQADPLPPSDGHPEMGEEFEREEGGVLEESGVPAPDAVEDGPGAEEDFDDLFGT